MILRRQQQALWWCEKKLQANVPIEKSVLASNKSASIVYREKKVNEEDGFALVLKKVEWCRQESTIGIEHMMKRTIVRQGSSQCQFRWWIARWRLRFHARGTCTALAGSFPLCVCARKNAYFATPELGNFTLISNATIAK